MHPKPNVLKAAESRKSVLPMPSRNINRPDDLEGGEETEIAAQISLPHESGWGWIVVAASFTSIFILDGVVYSFGSLLKSISVETNKSESLVALINSVAVSLYSITGPLASAFINRFGFRACTMSGATLCSISLFITYFSKSYASICIFYGFFAGIGYAFINMATSLVVGFYFEKLRSIALAISITGSSVGISAISPLNTYLVKIGGWRNTTLLHSGMFGLIYFLGMTYKPLLSLTVVQDTEDPTRTVTYLPNLSTAVLKTGPSRSRGELVPTATERWFNAVSNINFPTAAAVVEEDAATVTSQPGPSRPPTASKLIVTANNPHGSVSRRQLNKVKSIISKNSLQNETKKAIDIKVEEHKRKKRSCWERLCHWEPHVPESRPLYRDDAFYEGKVEKLPIYQKSVLDTTHPEGKTGLEYQLAVSRAAAATDLQERRGVFTTAIRRVLVSMLDPKLLSRLSFLCLIGNGVLLNLGLLVPYIYIQDRGKSEGIEEKHWSLFVSVIGFSNAIGRIVSGVLAYKIDPLILLVVANVIAGVSTIMSDLSYNVIYQYAYCLTFGFTISCLSFLRCMIIVDIYGLDTLTNATGMILMFQGLGGLVSTPLAAVLKDKFGYSIAFYVAGIFMTMGGLILIPTKKFSFKEAKKNEKKKGMPNKKNTV